MIGKVDDRNAERIMRTDILDRFVIKSPPRRPSDLLGQLFKKKKKKKMEKFRNFGRTEHCVKRIKMPRVTHGTILRDQSPESLMARFYVNNT